jgi:hypothetical protein
MPLQEGVLLMKKILVTTLICSCFLSISGCGRKNKLEKLFGAEVNQFDLEFSKDLYDAEIFRFKQGESEANRFSEKFGFNKIENSRYNYTGLAVDSPYFSKRDNIGTYVLVIGKISGDENWSLLVVDY